MNKERKPTLCVVAGPNGSGKTSTTIQLLTNEWSEGSLYINPDTDHFNGNEVSCLIWYKNGKYQGHASTALSTEQWTIVKS